MTKHNKIGQIIYLSAIFLLVGSFILFVLEKNQLTNLYNKPVEQSELIDGRPVNDINYDPAVPQDNEDINEKKSSGSLDSTQTQYTDEDPINIVITAAAQDVAGGPFVTRVLLTNTTSGTCTTTLSKDDINKTYQSNVINAGNYYTCEPIDIPIEDLSDGNWLLTVNVVSGNRTGSAEQDVKVFK